MKWLWRNYVHTLRQTQSLSMWLVKYLFTRFTYIFFNTFFTHSVWPQITHSIKSFTKRDNTLTDLLPIVLYILSTLESVNMLLHTYNDTLQTDTTTIDFTTQFCRFDPELPVPHYYSAAASSSSLVYWHLHKYNVSAATYCKVNKL